MVPAGLDLGSQRIRVAFLPSTERVEFLRGETGDAWVVNAVRFTDNEIVVGKAAAADAFLFRDEVAIWIKRELGGPFFSRPIRGEKLPPEVIQACVLRVIRSDLGNLIGQEAGWVIAVPHYFDEARRQAVVNAGRIAGMQVLDVIDEPLAAAIAWRHAQGETLRSISEPGQLLVVDLGASSLQLALFCVSAEECRLMGFQADLQLGGYDFDLQLAEIVAERMIRQGLPDPRSDPRLWSRFYPQIVEAKHALNAQNRVFLACDFGAFTFQTVVSREEFEQSAAKLLRRIDRTLAGFLSHNATSWSSLQEIVTVGGAVRMPCIQELLQRQSGHPISLQINPDEAIARGAALFAARRLAAEAGPVPAAESQETPYQDGWRVSNVLPYAVGICRPGSGGESVECLITRSTPLPVRTRRAFGLPADLPNQLRLPVLKNATGDWEPFGILEISGLPTNCGSDSELVITLSCSANGRLRFTAHLKPAGIELQTAFLTAADVSPNQLELWRKTIQGSKSGQEILRVAASQQGGEKIPETSSSAEASAQSPPPLSKDAAVPPPEVIPDSLPAERAPPREGASRPKHPRLAAAQSQGRWAPLEIALPPLPPGTQDVASLPLISPQDVAGTQDVAEKRDQQVPTGPSPPPLPPPLPGEVSSETRSMLRLPEVEDVRPIAEGGGAAEFRFRPRGPKVVREMLLGDQSVGVPPPILQDRLPSVTEDQGVGHVPVHVESPITPRPSDQGTSFARRVRSHQVRVRVAFGWTVPRWVVVAVGFALSAILGLGLGYWLISQLLPQSGILKLW